MDVKGLSSRYGVRKLGEEDVAALPPRKEDGDKFYIGFFMVDMFFQGKGIGTDIISDVAVYLPMEMDNL